jgi:hypothetical protein
VTIFARRAHLERVREALSDAIHGVLQEALRADKRFHRFLALDVAASSTRPIAAKATRFSSW